MLCVIVFAMRSVILIAHNLRSSYNVGSLLRTSEGLGCEAVFLTGYTPFPLQKNDKRLPHTAGKIHRQISKTSLGAEKDLGQHHDNIMDLISNLKGRGFVVVALEQTKNAKSLLSFKPPEKVALIVGREVEGLEPEIIKACDLSVEIPMAGSKESFNVAVAASIALYHCKYLGKLG